MGKTTACGKLALYLQKQKKSVLMVATDVYRPAAIDQLQKLGQVGNQGRGGGSTPGFEAGSNPACAGPRGVVTHVDWCNVCTLKVDMA